MLKLKVFNYQTAESQQTALTPETRGQCTIGRDPGCDLVVDGREVSRVHGKIIFQNKEYYYTDLSSRHGSRINNEEVKVDQYYVLKEDDIIRIGEFVLVIEAVETPSSDEDITTIGGRLNSDDRQVTSIDVENLVPIQNYYQDGDSNKSPELQEGQPAPTNPITPASTRFVLPTLDNLPPSDTVTNERTVVRSTNQATPEEERTVIKPARQATPEEETTVFRPTNRLTPQEEPTVIRPAKRASSQSAMFVTQAGIGLLSDSRIFADDEAILLPEESSPVKTRSKPVYLDKNLLIIFGVTLMAILGVSSITPVFPKIAQELNVPPQDIGMLITVFTFPSIILTPVLGVLADRFGRKNILAPSLILFGIAGVACAFASNFNLLLILRFIQGIGAASLNSLNVTLIGDLYSGKDRTSAMGYNASVGSIGTASYPLIGGAIAGLGWNYPFLLPILSVPIGLLVLFSLKTSELKNNQNFIEYIRQALGTVKNRQFFGLFFSTVATFILLYGALVTYMPLLMGDSFKASTLTIGIILSSMSATITLSSLQLGRLATKFSERYLITGSFLLFALALAIVPFIHSLWLLLIPTMIFGIGLGIGFPSIQTVLAELTPKEFLAGVMSINGTFIGLGQTLGPLLMGAAFGIWGISSVFYAGTILAIVTFLVFRRFTCA